MVKSETKPASILMILRTIQVFYLSFACFLAAYGELFPGMDFGVGRKFENVLVLPLLIMIVMEILKHWLKKSPESGDGFSKSGLFSNALRFTWREIILTCFIFFVALGFLYSPYPGVVRKGFIQVISASALYFLLLHAARSVKDFKMFTLAFLVGCFLTVGLGIAHHLSDNNAGTHTWGNRNLYGAFLHMPLALLLSLVVFYLKRWRFLILFGILLVFVLAGIYLSQSRGAWLGSVVVIIVVGMLGGRRGLLVAGTLILAAAIVILVRPPERIRKGGFQELFKISHISTKGRSTNVWPSALKVSLERPVMGYGLNTYRNVYEDRHEIDRPVYSETDDSGKRAKMQREYVIRDMRGNVHPHNEFLQAWTSMGIPGILSYLGFIAAMVMSYIKYRKLRLSGFPGAVGLGVFAWFVGHLIHGIFDCFFFFRHAFAAAAAMIAFMMGIYYLTLVPRRQKKLQDIPTDTGQVQNLS